MQIDILLKKITKWAESNKAVESTLLVGSYARGEARPDSDVDLVIICNNPKELLEDVKWINNFGEVIKHNIEDWGMVQSIRVFYKNGEEIEFGITTPQWATVPIDPSTQEVLLGGAKILVDKTSLLKQLLNAADKKV
jgi:predicted nucleotidyltransferase